jgi:hypothetical protein
MPISHPGALEAVLTETEKPLLPWSIWRDFLQTSSLSFLNECHLTVNHTESQIFTVW